MENISKQIYKKNYLNRFLTLRHTWSKGWMPCASNYEHLKARCHLFLLPQPEYHIGNDGRSCGAVYNNCSWDLFSVIYILMIIFQKGLILERNI